MDTESMDYFAACRKLNDARVALRVVEQVVSDAIAKKRQAWVATLDARGIRAS